MEKILLKDLIKNLNEYDESLNAILICQEMSSTSICIIKSDEELSSCDYESAIGIYLIRDIIDNLSLQKKNYSEEEASE